MKWFRTTNATRPYKINGHTFTFDQLSFASGAWTGVLDLDDDSGEILSQYGPPVTEISKEEYDELKKKNSKVSPHTGQAITPVPQDLKQMQEEPLKEPVVAEDLQSEIGLASVEVKDSLAEAKT